jgi:hypothetical protein
VWAGCPGDLTVKPATSAGELKPHVERSPISVITRPAEPGVVIKPFDRLTALSEVEGLDAHVASLLGMTVLGSSALITQIPAA